MRCPLVSCKWDPPGAHLARYMGLPQIGESEIPEDPWLREMAAARRLYLAEPFESNSDGCPGGWYRTEFFASLTHYLRPATGDGGYAPNVRLDRCDDTLVIDAVGYYEVEQQRCRAWQQRWIDDRRSRE